MVGLACNICFYNFNQYGNQTKTDSELVGLVRGLTDLTPLEAVPMLKKPEFWAVLSLAICLFLNFYFW